MWEHWGLLFLPSQGKGALTFWLRRRRILDSYQPPAVAMCFHILGIRVAKTACKVELCHWKFKFVNVNFNLSMSKICPFHAQPHHRATSLAGLSQSCPVSLPPCLLWNHEGPSLGEHNSCVITSCRPTAPISGFDQEGSLWCSLTS